MPDNVSRKKKKTFPALAMANTISFVVDVDTSDNDFQTNYISGIDSDRVLA